MRHGSQRRLLTGACGALALAVLAPPAARAAVPDRPRALAGYRVVQQAERVPVGWTGSTADCAIGTESPASLAATLRTVNTLRAFAGVGAVAFDARLNRQALAAAVMMRASGVLSHVNGPGAPCYTAEGAQGAGMSNLFLGASAAGAILGYLDDGGTLGVEHRRWVLDPETTVMGSGSTDESNALYVVTYGHAPVAPGTRLSWPPAGWVPWQWIFKDWSLAIGGPAQEQDVSFQDPVVSVTIDGVPAPVGGLLTLGTGYGSAQSLKWQVSVPEQLTAGDHTIHVAVGGVVVDGRPLPVAWTTQAFQPDPPAPRFVRGPRIVRPGGPGSRVRAGQRLVASATVTGGTIARRRWLRDGRIIIAATHSTYRVRHRDSGHVMTLRVTAAAPGGTPETRRTSPRVHISR